MAANQTPGARPRLRPWMLASVIWFVPAVLATIDQIAQRRLHGEPPATARDLLWASGDWLVYAFVTPAIFWATRRWPVARPHLVRRGALHLGLALLFCVAWATSGTLLRLALFRIFEPGQLQTFASEAGGHLWRRVGLDLVSWIFTTLPFGVIVYLSLTGLAHAMRYFVESSDREVRLARVSEQLAGARFAALQAQLNPHFLFNTLNTIAVRARDGDSTGTVRMVEQLSDLLRRTLGRHRASEVTLGDELDLVQEYLGIELARFSDRLQATVDVATALRAAAVPAFAVQHLVENAVRHGIAKRIEAGRVQVVAARDGDSLVVTVSDDGPGIPSTAIETGPSAPGHGLENTRERLRALYGTRASLTVSRREPSGTLATLRVPYREIPGERDRVEP